MTHCKCFTKHGRHFEKTQNASADHTNKDCHLKKIIYCYAHNSSSKDASPRKTKCEKCVCTVKNCSTDVTRSPCLEDYDKPYQKSDRIPHKEKSPEKILCKVCCCLLKNCCCREKSPSNTSRPRTLSRDLPLYDEKSHLLGYIKKGSIIDYPSCTKSRDDMLDHGAAQELGEKANGTSCMSSCRFAEGIRRHNKAVAVPRWTTKSAFQYSTLTDRPTSPIRSKTKKCPC